MAQKASEVRAKAKAQLQKQVAERTDAALGVVESHERMEELRVQSSEASTAYEKALQEALGVMTAKELQALTDLTEHQLRPRKRAAKAKDGTEVRQPVKVDLSTTGAGQPVH
jgi:uncharacterized membrane protein